MERGRGGKERHRVEGGEKRRWPERRDAGLRGPQQRARGARLQQAASCVPLLKYKGIKKLFVGAQ